MFAADNPLLAEILADRAPRKALVVLEDSLAQAQPELEHQIQILFAARRAAVQLVRPPLFVCGSESAKNSPIIVNEILAYVDRHHIDRHSYLIAVGGGALLDVAGYAAAIAHRGVRHVRIPTTTLSQADSGVGVKNGLNAFNKKNFIGTFAPPFAVINDFNFLATLEPRDKRGGYVEAVKVACIRDAAFFAEMERDAEKLVAFEPVAMQALIRRSAELHLEHIATSGDPFEMGSARPLDFGHWAAHKLEQLSNFQLSHSEAVAVGIALDVTYSRLARILDEPSSARILKLLEKLGFRLFADELLNADGANRPVILSGLEEFREHLGGELTITLLKKIGVGVEVNTMDEQKILAAIHELKARQNQSAIALPARKPVVQAA